MASYQAVAAQSTRLQVNAVELPGRGRRANETAVSRFGPLSIPCCLTSRAGAERHHRFSLWEDSASAVLAYEFACRLEQCVLVFFFPCCEAPSGHRLCVLPLVPRHWPCIFDAMAPVPLRASTALQSAVLALVSLFS